MTLHLGSNLELLASMADNSVDSVVTDPPYGLGKAPDALEMLRDWLETGHHEVRGRGFMGKEWDAFVPQPNLWKECLRVLKPGGYLLAFSGTRTMDLMALGLRIAGFEIRDILGWLFGSGFPKSHNIGKALDRREGAEREVLEERPSALAGSADATQSGGRNYRHGGNRDLTAPATQEAQQWEGWGSALKPAYEPIIMARKPLVGTLAENTLEYGVGGLNIDGCRIASPGLKITEDGRIVGDIIGRWPANIMHDGSEEALGVFPKTGASKAAPRGGTNPNPMDWGGDRKDGKKVAGFDDDGGSAARFFYCAKASKADRDEGLESFPEGPAAAMVGNLVEGGRMGSQGPIKVLQRANHHPTVKPTALMRYLCRLTTPPNGTILDPFMGSGSTGKAAILEGFRFVGAEIGPEYFEIAKARVAWAQAEVERLAKMPKQIALF